MTRFLFLTIFVIAIVASTLASMVKRSPRSAETCGVRESRLGLMVHGVNFSRGTFPWIVALFRTDTTPNSFFCGGTIISNTFVISAAHCILHKHQTQELRPRDVLALFGAHNLTNFLETGRYALSPKRIFIHDDWNPLTSEYDADVSLLQFESRSIHFNTYVQPICMFNSDHEPSVTEGTVTGWGRSEDSWKSHENLPKLLQVSIQTNDKCLPSNGKLADLSSERTFCAGLRNGSGVCTGDSGSGLFYELDGASHLKGIVSSSLMKIDGCDVWTDAIYTNVPKFRDWIRKMTMTTQIRPPIDEKTAKLLKKLKTNLLPKAPLCGTQLVSKIFGGEAATIYDFNWLVLLEYKKPNGRPNGFHCGGSLINDRYVLTAAQCVEKIDPEWELISVRVGENNLESDKDCDPDDEESCLPPVQNIRIAQKIVHPDYRKQYRNSSHDIALLRLRKKVALGDFVRPICLPVAQHLWNKNYNGQRLTVAGWGKTKNESKSEVKRFVELPSVKIDKCRKDYANADKKPTDQHMCAGGEIGKDSCAGDSGGPLMAKDPANPFEPYFVAGIVCYGPAECGTEGVAGVYTKVANYLGWIVDNIKP